MKILSFLTLVTLAAGCAFGQAELGSHTWTATVKVVNDNDQPVEGANVSVSYFLPASETQNTDKQWDEIKGLSDADGTFTASHTDGSLSLGIHAQKGGYYSTYLDHELYLPGQFDEQTVAANRNPTLKVVLKKIGNPIPMYANRVDIAHKEKPALDKQIGFDLMAGDWIAPYGKGRNADMFFTWHVDQDMNVVPALGTHDNRGSDSKLTISFPNSGDGIQEFDVPGRFGNEGSELRSPQKAPAEGYESQLIKLQSWHPDRASTNTYDHIHKNYFLRVQTVLDENGKVKSALYGKIYGDFDEVFSTYLNPEPNSRNMEFDPKQNLSQNKKPREPKVTAP